VNAVVMTAGAIALRCLPGILLVALLLALYGVGKSLARASRQIRHILHATETRKEIPKP